MLDRLNENNIIIKYVLKKKIIVTKEAMPRILFHVLGCMTERILKVHHTSTISNSCENGRDLGGFFLFLQQSDSLQ